MMKPFDCHCHLYDKAFDADRDKVIADSKKVLSGIVVVSEDLETIRKVLELCKKYPGFLFPGLAVHPDRVHKLSNADIDKTIAFIRKQKGLVCIGECGLDYMRADESENPEETRVRQRETFRKQIKLADEMSLPLNIHSRRSVQDVIKILKELRPRKALLHGFSGSPEEAKEAIKLGYKIAVSTSIFYSKEALEIVKHLPAESFILETDSPVRAPIRGERNVPTNISLVVKEIAKMKKLSESKVIEETNKNFREMFDVKT